MEESEASPLAIQCQSVLAFLFRRSVDNPAVFNVHT